MASASLAVFFIYLLAELEMMKYLTGKSYKDWDIASTKESTAPIVLSYTALTNTPETPNGKQPVLLATIGVGLLLIIDLRRKHTE